MHMRKMLIQVQLRAHGFIYTCKRLSIFSKKYEKTSLVWPIPDPTVQFLDVSIIGTCRGVTPPDICHFLPRACLREGCVVVGE